MNSRAESWLLRAGSRIYGIVVAVRNALYDAGLLRRYAVSLPVICVGNISVGGNAKTPLVRYLCAMLAEQGMQPVVLSRGYGGRMRGPHLVTNDDLPSQVGDEPLMLARSGGVPVVIAKNRVRGAQFIVQSEIGNVIVLDDGFQHRRLARNLDILSVNVSSDASIAEFIEGRLLPAGRFREPRLAALQRAHMLVFADRKIVQKPVSLPERLFASLPHHLQLYRSNLKYCGMQPVTAEESLPAGAAVVVLSAIANPGGFTESVAGLGYTVLDVRSFPDHYAFTQKDVDAIAGEFSDASLICTEKDLVKLSTLTVPRLHVLQTALEVVPADAFRVHVMKGLRQPQRGKVTRIPATRAASRKAVGAGRQ